MVGLFVVFLTQLKQKRICRVALHRSIFSLNLKSSSERNNKIGIKRYLQTLHFRVISIIAILDPRFQNMVDIYDMKSFFVSTFLCSSLFKVIIFSVIINTLSDHANLMKKCNVWKTILSFNCSSILCLIYRLCSDRRKIDFLGV